jgi:hypothetical protein
MPYRGILSGRHKRLVVQQADRDPESLADHKQGICPVCDPEQYAAATPGVSRNDVIAWLP